MAEVKQFLWFDVVVEERCRVVSRKVSFSNIRVEYELDGTTAYVNEQDIYPIIRLWFVARA